MRRIAVKVGTLILSDAEERPRRGVLREIVADIASARAAGNELIVIGSGAVLWGREAIGLSGNVSVEVPGRERRAETRAQVRMQVLASVGQPLMAAEYLDRFAEHEICIAQLLVTSHDLVDRDRYERLVVVTNNLIRNGILPVFSQNDPLSSDDLRYSDDDRLAATLAAALHVDRLVIFTAADELCDAPATSLATAFGVEVTIAGAQPGALLSLLLEGDGAAVTVAVRGHHLGHRKSWIALTAKSRGTIVVSSFLAEKLSQRRAASVLLIGIEEAVGSFRAHDVVTVKDIAGRVLGRGEVRLSSDDLREKLQQRDRGEGVDYY